MIPSIEEIVTGLISGTYSHDEAVEWLNVYANSDGLRDMYAGQALTGLLSRSDKSTATQHIVTQAHTIADQMVAARRVS